MVKDPLLQRVVEAFKKRQIDFIALFGSRAKGLARPDSDYDILIEYSWGVRYDHFELVEAKQEAEAILGKKVDLVTTPALSKFIRDEVLSTLIVLHGSTPRRFPLPAHTGVGRTHSPIPVRNAT
jgi:predicted nucleotidyltransferase